jgi:hypothetical protein
LYRSALYLAAVLVSAIKKLYVVVKTKQPNVSGRAFVVAKLAAQSESAMLRAPAPFDSDVVFCPHRKEISRSTFGKPDGRDNSTTTGMHHCKNF